MAQNNRKKCENGSLRIARRIPVPIKGMVFSEKSFSDFLLRIPEEETIRGGTPGNRGEAGIFSSAENRRKICIFRFSGYTPSSGSRDETIEKQRAQI